MIKKRHTMSKMRFGAFLAPHHPIGEHPTLQLQSDLELVTHMDKLGYDEFWGGEHHSTGWEIIASPEIFLAGAAERTQRIIFGSCPGSLPSDALTLGIDAMVLRARQ